MFVVGALAPIFGSQVAFFKGKIGTEAPTTNETHTKWDRPDIKTAQFGWPLGMPLIRKLDKDLWEVRSNLDNRIARTLFTVEGDLMVLLHGFVKKSQKIPQKELSIAQKRLAMLRK